MENKRDSSDGITDEDCGGLIRAKDLRAWGFRKVLSAS